MVGVHRGAVTTALAAHDAQEALARSRNTVFAHATGSEVGYLAALAAPAWKADAVPDGMVTISGGAALACAVSRYDGGD
eukprot:89765-Prymnesium_polylepis.1